MIEEQGCVVVVEQDAVWVEILRENACSSCSGNAGCGRGVMDKLGMQRRYIKIRALSDLRLQAGDTVVVGVREEFLVRASFLVYLFPLLAFFSCSALAQELGLVESLVILSGILGFGLACGLVGLLSWSAKDNLSMQPRVLRVLLNDPVGAR